MTATARDHGRTSRTGAPLAGGALLRNRHGQRFRMTDDGTHVHRAADVSKRTVVHVAGDITGRPRLPSGALRTLLAVFETGDDRDRPRRSWRLTQTAGRWHLALRLEGAGQGKAMCPDWVSAVRPGIAVNPDDYSSLARVMRHLWEQADEREQRARTADKLSA